MTLEETLLKIDRLRHLIGKELDGGKPYVELLVPVPTNRNLMVAFVSRIKNGDKHYDELAEEFSVSDFEILVLHDGSIGDLHFAPSGDILAS